MASSLEGGLPAPLPSLALAALLGAGVALAGAYYLHRKQLKDFELLRNEVHLGPGRKGRRGERKLSGEDSYADDSEHRHHRRKKHSQSPSRRRRHPPAENGGAFDPLRGGAHLPDGQGTPVPRTSSEQPDRPKMTSVASLPHLGAASRSGSEHMSRTETPAGAASANGMPPLPRIVTHKPEASSSLSKSGTRRVQSLQDLRRSAPTSPVKSQFARVELTDEDDDEAMQAEAEERLRDADADDEGQGNEEEEAERQEEELIAKKEEQERLNWHVPNPDRGAAPGDGKLGPDALLKAPEPIAAYEMRKVEEPETYTRVTVTPEVVPGPEEVEVCSMLQECMELRKKYVFRARPPWHSDRKWPARDPATHKLIESPFQYTPEAGTDHVFSMKDGVMTVFPNKESEENLFPVPDSVEFFTDLHRVLRIANYGGVKTFCHQRLRLLEQKFQLHLMLNADREFLAQKSAPHRDFYNVRKVDTHVHHSACMNQKHLLRFIKAKLRKEPDEVVIFRDGKYLTLREVFESLDLTGYDLNVDLLDVHADRNTFHRFDKFNLKYNPCGQSRLREIFLKQDNMIQGRFLAELTKEVLSDLAASKYQMAEYRISIYGRKQSEWDQLASWIVNNDLYSDNVVWLIQLPRLYNVYKEMGIIQDFQTMLDNIFIPLFEVTADPSSHPQLHVFLQSVAGVDMVDDESKPERRPTKHMQTPEQWQNPFNPAYSYWAYYVWANLTVLNRFRESKGYTTLTFRPHSGEAGDIDHLAATFLTCHNIAHGNNLRKSPSLQYLYYLAQIGLAMSPLSNNSLFLDYHRNPFPMFFARGMNVSLSTDDPLMIHLTKEPLVEEYSIAAQVWKLSACDLCEVARNSVYQSGFQHDVKAHWVGDKYYLRGPDGNDIHKTNVPHMRVEFRHEVWKGELQFIYFGEADIPQEIDS